MGCEDSLEKEVAIHSSILPGKNPLDRGAWQATIHGVTKESDTTQRLNKKLPLTPASPISQICRIENNLSESFTLSFY